MILCVNNVDRWYKPYVQSHIFFTESGENLKNNLLWLGVKVP
jgi:hypothetical protein